MLMRNLTKLKPFLSISSSKAIASFIDLRNWRLVTGKVTVDSSQKKNTPAVYWEMAFSPWVAGSSVRSDALI